MALTVGEKNYLLNGLSAAVDNLGAAWDSAAVAANKAGDNEFIGELNEALNMLIEESDLPVSIEPTY